IDHAGCSALFYAIEKGNTDAVSLLVDIGANLNLQSDDGDTPLMYATECRQATIAKALIDHGADIELRNNRGQTAIVVEALLNIPEIGKALVGRRAHDKAIRQAEKAEAAGVNLNTGELGNKSGVFIGGSPKRGVDTNQTAFIEALSE